MSSILHWNLKDQILGMLLQFMKTIIEKILLLCFYSSIQISVMEQQVLRKHTLAIQLDFVQDTKSQHHKFSEKHTFLS